MDYLFLIDEALEARKHSYSPYSGFMVGAALLCSDGTVYKGANIENCSYGATICAERNAIFKAVYDGKRKFDAIAIVGDKRENEEPKGYAYPCGICRQVMSEFFDSSTKVIVAKNNKEYKEYRMSDILPMSFEM